MSSFYDRLFRLGMGKFARLAKSVSQARKAVGKKQNEVHPTDMDLSQLSGAAGEGGTNPDAPLPRYMREKPQAGFST